MFSLTAHCLSRQLLTQGQLSPVMSTFHFRVKGTMERALQPVPAMRELSSEFSAEDKRKWLQDGGSGDGPCARKRMCPAPLRVVSR